MKNILILCTGNSCRSQMAHGFIAFFGGKNVTVYSAGIETHGLNSRAVSIMLEAGIDISKNTSNHVDEYATVEFDHIITVCDHAKENCPYIPSKNAQRWHHNFSDPSKLNSKDEKKIHQAFAATRNEIKDYCERFVNTHL
ncbi:MAG: arsenate reductase ArsC [Flavobacteriaceae bacterium]|nr:arsenate reductase ArsC [Flavobacteriaceae bacterium]